jgi:hypothetical protein
MKDPVNKGGHPGLRPSSAYSAFDYGGQTGLGQGVSDALRKQLHEDEKTIYNPRPLTKSLHATTSQTEARDSKSSCEAVEKGATMQGSADHSGVASKKFGAGSLKTYSR